MLRVIRNSFWREIQIFKYHYSVCMKPTHYTMAITLSQRPVMVRLVVLRSDQSCQMRLAVASVTRCYQMWPDITTLEWNEKKHFAYEATQLLTSPLQFMTCGHGLAISRYARRASSLWPRNSLPHLGVPFRHNTYKILFLFNLFPFIFNSYFTTCQYESIKWYSWILESY